ncbi:MAG TPA: transposase [Terriglobia bacterium]|nr:transposase [Terriglobia bacterium]
MKWHERPAEGEVRIDHRNGSYGRGYVTPLGGVQVQVSRTRKRSFLPRGIKALQRRSLEVAELIRQAFLRGIATRAVGRVVPCSPPSR